MEFKVFAKKHDTVAENDNYVISKAIVCDLIDKQNNAFAKRTCSLQVEEHMKKLNFQKEAAFCKMIREWYEAEDTPGISAVERCKRRLTLKDYLLESIDFGMYPLPGMYIKGIPKVMFEAFLQRIDTTVQLFQIIKSGSYNSRAISSLVNETFFGELSELEATKLGCPKAISIPRLMSAVTEIQHFRCDPERNFKIITTRKSVYPQQSLLCDGVQTHATVTDAHSGPDKIRISNHPFDSTVRRKKQRKSKRSDVSKPNEVSRGCLPIRAHHKCDESKILPTTRLGMNLK